MPQPKYQKIICLGDSITCNWKFPSYVDHWQELANAEYGKNQVEIMAAGINGETAQDAYYRLDRDVVAHSPNLVTIMFGHNEADPHRNTSPILFANYLRKIINYLQHYQPHTDIWLLSPQEVGSSTYVNRYQAYIAQIELAAKEKNCHYVSLWHVFDGQNLADIYTKQINSTYIRGTGIDLVHPNDTGQQIIAQKLMSELLHVST